MFRGPWYIATRLWSVGMGYQAGGLSMVLMAMVGYAARCFLTPVSSTVGRRLEKPLPIRGSGSLRRDGFLQPSSK
jgi:hypothetical protein